MGVDEVGEIVERVFTLEDVFHVKRPDPRLTTPPTTAAAVLARITDMFAEA